MKEPRVDGMKPTGEGEVRGQKGTEDVDLVPQHVGHAVTRQGAAANTNGAADVEDA